MANVQLKAYWACFPLTPSPTSLENREAKIDITGQDNTGAPRKQGRNERKQLLESLRSSIEEKGQAEAKKRKVNEPLKLPANSETGKDPKDLNRGSKVEVVKDDLQRSEFKKRGMQPCFSGGSGASGLGPFCAPRFWSKKTTLQSNDRGGKQKRQKKKIRPQKKQQRTNKKHITHRQNGKTNTQQTVRPIERSFSTCCACCPLRLETQTKQNKHSRARTCRLEGSHSQ